MQADRLRQEGVRVGVYAGGRVAQDRGLLERPGLEDRAVQVQVVDLAVLLGVGIRASLVVRVLEPLEQGALIVDGALDSPLPGEWVLAASRAGLDVAVFVSGVVGDVLQ